MGIIWKSVVDYEGYYEISNDGQVRSISRKIKSNRQKPYLVKGKIKKVFKDKDGYCLFRASKNGKGKILKVHREMLKSFSPVENNNFLQVKHKNGVKDDNRLINLEWFSVCENDRHQKNILNRFNRSKILSDEQFLEVAHLFLDGEKVSKISKKFNVSEILIRCFLRLDTHRPLLIKHNLDIPLLKEIERRTKNRKEVWSFSNYLKVKKLKEQGLTQKVIAAYFKVALSVIKKAYKIIREKEGEKN